MVKYSGIFSHEFASEYSDDVIINDLFFRNLLTVVTCDSIDKRQGRPFSEEKVENLKKFKTLYDSYIDNGILHIIEGGGKNLSHVFAGLAAQMMTSYNNNIIMHFDKYLKKFIRMKVENYVAVKLNLNYYELPTEDKKETKSIISKLIRLFFKNDTTLDDKDLVKLEEWQQVIMKQVSELIPKNTKIFQWVINPNPNIYLPYMIYMTREMELCNKKLLKPLPMRNHYIPGSITLDTAALIDILIQNDDDFNQLKTYLQIEEDYNMDKITSKSQLYDKPEKLINNVKNSAIFKTGIWKFFIKDTSKLIYRNLIFNNCITTNGHKIGIHYVNKEAFGLTKFTKGFYFKDPVSENYKYVTQLSEEERTDLLDETKFTPSGRAAPSGRASKFMVIPEKLISWNLESELKVVHS
jgi:hypothetical protein